MPDESREELPRHPVILPGLGTAEGMGEGVEPFDTPLHKILILPDERLRDIIYAAYCRDDPELISRGSSPVRSEISEKALRLPPFKRGMGRTVAVFQLSGEICGHIVAVNPFSGRDLPRRMADAAAVFYNIRSLLQGIKSEFVPLRDILSQPDGDPIHLELASRGDRPDRNCDIVLRIDMHKLCHISPPLPKALPLPGSGNMILSIVSASQGRKRDAAFRLS